MKLTFKELTTVSTQIEACLNSRPLTPLPRPEDGTEVLTPRHFLVGAPLEALRQLSTLCHWHRCQALVRYLWQRWSMKYLCQVQLFTKGLSALDPDSIHIDITPQSSLHMNWIVTGSIHFDPVRTTNLARDDSYTKPNYHHMIAYLPLAVTQSCFCISHPAGFGHCLLPIHTTTSSFLVQSDNRLTFSTNTCFN